MSHACFVCRSDKLAPLIDIGPQPISNRFLHAPGDPEERYPIALEQCEACGLVQIDRPVPAAALVPPYDWIAYNEPEGHLDGLVDILMSLPGIAAGSVAGGVSSKDDSTLARLERKGLETWRLDLREDLGVSELSGQGVETVQDRLTPERADNIVQRRGRADVLLVRHILEHSSRPPDFIEALKRLVTPTATSCRGAGLQPRDGRLRLYDDLGGTHALLHARHVRQTFRSPASHRTHGELSVRSKLARRDRDRSIERRGVESPAVVRASAGAGRRSGEFSGAAREGQMVPARAPRSRGPIALFGAGHLACTFVTVFDVADMIECIIDDNPNKRGLYMPGSGLPIVGSSALRDDGISLCLLSLNPIGEEKVIGNHQAFVDRGGVFASIFPASAHAMRL